MKYIFTVICLFFCTLSVFAYSNNYGSASSAARSYYSSHAYYGGATQSASAAYRSYSNYNSATPSLNSSFSTSKNQYSQNYFYKPASLTHSSYVTTASKIKNNQANSGVDVVPFRYNTLNYTKIRNMEADSPKKYSAKCTDLGDASFCQ